MRLCPRESSSAAASRVFRGIGATSATLAITARSRVGCMGSAGRPLSRKTPEWIINVTATRDGVGMYATWGYACPRRARTEAAAAWILRGIR